MVVIVPGQKEEEEEEGPPLYISSLYYMMNEDFPLAHTSWMMQEEHSVKNAGLCSSWLMCGPHGTVRSGRRVQTYEVNVHSIPPSLRDEQRRSSSGDQEKISTVGLTTTVDCTIVLNST